MKKILIGLAVLSALSYGKEIVAEPIVIEEPVVVAPVVEEVIVEEVVVAPVVAPAVWNYYGRIGGDVWSKYSKFEGLNDKTYTIGYEAAVEITRNFTPNFELGLGTAYQVHSRNKTVDFNSADGVYEGSTKMAKYNSVPVYATGKYNFDSMNGFVPYLKANVGYSFNIKDGHINSNDADGTSFSTRATVDNGLYYAAGAGVEYNNIVMDVMYQVNQAKASLSNLDNTLTQKSKLDYSRVTLSLGYKF